MYVLLVVFEQMAWRQDQSGTHMHTHIQRYTRVSTHTCAHDQVAISLRKDCWVCVRWIQLSMCVCVCESDITYLHTMFVVLQLKNTHNMQT